MAIPNETMIKKMMDELTEAQSNQGNPDQMVKHIEHVRLLSELFLEGATIESDRKSVSPKDISDVEMKAMLGASKAKNSGKRDAGQEDNEANGKSIFDF